MAESKKVARSETTVQPTAGEQPVRRATDYLLPPVDVFEDETGIIVYADLPGVAGERLNLQVDQNTLLIEGEVDVDLPEGIQPLYAEVRTRGFRRSFALSSELDPDRVEANLKDGVLRLRLPRKTPYQPRKIQVQAG